MKTKAFIFLDIGDVVRLDDGRTAKIVSCPAKGIIRNLYGVEMRVTDGDLTWSEMPPQSIVELA